MLTFSMIPDKEKFLDMVAHSSGEVLLHLPDGSKCDLKRDRLARQLLRMLEPSQDGLQISLSNQRDTIAFIRYMQEAAL